MADALQYPLPALGAVAADLVTHPLWTTDVHTTPELPVPGGALTIHIDAPATAHIAYLFIGFAETLAFVNGVPLTVAFEPRPLILIVPLDGSGHLDLAGALPPDPRLSGLELDIQCAVPGPGATIGSVSNLWRTVIQ